MRLDTRRVRSLFSNSSGARSTAPSPLSHIPAGTMLPAQTPKGEVSVAFGRSDGKLLGVPAEPKKTGDVGMETANANTGSAASSIGAASHFSHLLYGFIETGTGRDQQGNTSGKGTQLYEIYRDIHRFDPVAGPAVDMMSNMPFSDFSLAGAKDAKYLVPYEESIDNTHVRSLFPTLSNEYLVHGLFCSTTVFSDEDRHYKGLIPQNIDYIDILPMPVWGQDPLITLQIGDALQTMERSLDAQDERLEAFKKMLPPELLNNKDKKATHKPKPEDVIYIPRGGLARDTRGVSIYDRMLPAWLMEKALFRGTLDQAVKRQKAISHMVVGDGDWEPTTTEMQQLAQMLLQADFDPVGAVFVTRSGVSVSDIRDNSSLWKWNDMTEFFTTTKLRAMGISESFLTGDATYNSLEQVMSVMVEQMRAFREKVTSEIFYERMFPRIAEAWNYKNKSHGLSLELANRDPRQIEMFNIDMKDIPVNYIELANERQDYGKISYRNREMLIPQVHWHKRLRPEADDAYLAMLGTLSEKGVPVPVRLWAAAGGLDLQTLVNQKDEDMKIRDNLLDWVKSITKFQSAVVPADPGMGGGGGFGGEGGGEGGDAGGGGDEFASAAVTGLLSGRAVPVLSRTFDSDEYDVQNRGSDGKRHLLSAAGKKYLDEKINRQIAEVAKQTATTVNRFEKKMDDKFNDLHKKIKHYFAGS